MEKEEIDIIITNVDGNHYDLWINGDEDLEIEERFIYTPGTKNADFSKGAEPINKYQFGFGIKINKENIKKFDLKSSDKFGITTLLQNITIDKSTEKFILIDSTTL